MLEAICPRHEHRMADREKPQVTIKQLEASPMSRQQKISLLTVRNQLTGDCNAKELCVLSGGGLLHHSCFGLGGSRFAVRSASCTSNRGTQSFRRI